MAPALLWRPVLRSSEGGGGAAGCSLCRVWWQLRLPGWHSWFAPGFSERRKHCCGVELLDCNVPGVQPSLYYCVSLLRLGCSLQLIWQLVIATLRLSPLCRMPASVCLSFCLCCLCIAHHVCGAVDGNHHMFSHSPAAIGCSANSVERSLTCSKHHVQGRFVLFPCESGRLLSIT